MSEPAPEVRCRCSACRVDAAELLLRTRRPGMALRLLQDVPMQLTEALGMAYARGHDNAVLGQASGPPLAVSRYGDVRVSSAKDALSAESNRRLPAHRRLPEKAASILVLFMSRTVALKLGLS